MDNEWNSEADWFMDAEIFRHLMRAIIDTKDHLDRIGAKAAAEHWCLNDTKFAEMKRKVVDRWAGLTGHEPWRFPFTDSCVRETWVGFRKLNTAKKPVCRQWAGCFMSEDKPTEEPVPLPEPS